MSDRTPRTAHGWRTASAAAATAVLAALVLATAGVAGASASRPLIVPVGPDGSSPGAVHRGRAPAASVEPGANGSIAFVSTRYAATPNVFTVDPTNPTAVSRLTGCTQSRCPGGAISPAWSPDGRMIAFVRGADGEGSGPLYTMFSSGGTQVQVGSVVGESPTWSPDASLLAYAATAGGPNEDIYVAAADGTGTPVDLTNDAASPDLQPAWSPDGTKIAYLANGQGGTTDVYVMNANGTGSPVDITNSAAAEQHPAWSPDGTKIAYDDGTGISWIPAAGGSPTPVVPDGVMPSWSGDGTLIAYSTSRTGNFEVFTSTVDGSTQTQVTTDPAADTLPVWQSIQVTIATSASVVHFRDLVTITAHLNVYQETTNPNLSIYKRVFNGNRYLVATGPVDANGDFVKSIQVYDRTVFSASWDGDGSHPPALSTQRVVQVQSVTSGALSGYYGISGSYRLYHYTTQCVGSKHVGCPVYTVTVVPDGTGLPVDFTLQQLFGSTWKTIGQFSYPLGTGSKLAVKLTYGNNGVIGHAFRIMAGFQGNGGSLPSASDWSYFKITT